MNTTLPSLLRSAALMPAAFLAATLAAQTTSPTLPEGALPPSSTVNVEKAPPKLSHHDKTFLEEAEKGGRKEVVVSQAVMDRVVNPQVRDFATMMVTDHTPANREIMNLAMAKGVALPEPADMKITEKWTEKGGDLDRKYIHEMVGDHEDAVKLFEKAAKSEDPDIAAFAQKTLPTLLHHLSVAKDLKKTLEM